MAVECIRSAAASSRASAPEGLLERGRHGPIVEERCPLIEGWVANVLRPSISYGNLPIEMSYLPRQGGHSEVDFILAHGDELVAIEVKSSDAVDSRALKGLRSI